MTFRELANGCWFQHLEPIWEAQHFRCLTCGTKIDVLPQAAVRGPKAIPDPVRGQPTEKATPVRAQRHVHEFKRQSER